MIVHDLHLVSAILVIPTQQSTLIGHRKLSSFQTAAINWNCKVYEPDLARDLFVFLKQDGCTHALGLGMTCSAIDQVVFQLLHVFDTRIHRVVLAAKVQEILRCPLFSFILSKIKTVFHLVSLPM